MSYCRIAYDTNEDRKLILNGYSLMTDWHDATLFETKEEALNIILNRINIIF
jgi:hypothetical protein